MNNKFKTWFIGLSRLSKTILVIVITVLIVSCIHVAANPCDSAEIFSTKTVPVSIRYQVVKTSDPTINTGNTEVTQSGLYGVNLVTYRIGTKCGKQESKKVIKTVVKSNPVDEHEQVGIRDVTTNMQVVDIPYTNQNVDDSSMDKGTSKVVQAGIDGSKNVSYQVISVNGQEVSRTEMSEEVTIQPTPQITHIGTYVPAAPAAQAPTKNCDPNYTPCIPYYSGDALNCPDIGIEVRVIGVDHNHFDRDGDGYGCESYGS